MPFSFPHPEKNIENNIHQLSFTRRCSGILLKRHLWSGHFFHCITSILLITLSYKSHFFRNKVYQDFCFKSKLILSIFNSAARNTDIFHQKRKRRLIFLYVFFQYWNNRNFKVSLMGLEHYQPSQKRNMST